MKIEFDSKLFGVEDNDLSYPFGSDQCSPVWDDAAGKWTFDQELGTCGMKVESLLESNTE